MAQSHPPTHATFGALVASTARQWRRAINRQLQPLGLTEATWLPLLHVARASAPMRQKDLAAVLTLDTSSVVRLLDELQAAGLIERREGEDRRAKRIHVTAAGRAVAATVEQQSRRVRERLLAGVEPADLAIAVQVLEQVQATLATLEEPAGAAPVESC